LSHNLLFCGKGFKGENPFLLQLAVEPQPIFFRTVESKGEKPFLLYSLALEPQSSILGKGGLRGGNPFCFIVL